MATALDLPNLDPLALALAAEESARTSLAAAGILGACCERCTGNATLRAIEHGQAMVSVARLLGFVAEHYATLLPVFEALAAGDRVEVEEGAPERATRDERPALAVVVR